MVFSILLAAGCAHHPSRAGVLSQELPITLDDLAEIRAGEQHHEKVLWEYRLYESPQLQTYCNAIAANIAAVSTRPHLPYKVFLLDSDEVNIFGGPGGYIYLTKGLLNFVESESELAGVIAHEITHVANYDYSNIPHLSRVQQVYGLVSKGVELAKDSGVGGPYGAAASMGIKNFNRAAPMLAKRFGKDQEIKTDELAVQSLLKAGYDPRGYFRFVDKLSKVELDDIAKFVVLLNAHPPFQDRKALLQARIQGMRLESGKIEFKQDTLNEVRRITIKAPDSIIFQPGFMTAPKTPSPISSGAKQTNPDDLGVDHKRVSLS